MKLVSKKDLEWIGVAEALAESAGTTAEFIRYKADADRMRAELGSLAADESVFIEEVKAARLAEYRRGE